jgi:hypothetical protein
MRRSGRNRPPATEAPRLNAVPHPLTADNAAAAVAAVAAEQPVLR